MNVPVLRLVQRFAGLPGHGPWVSPGEIAVVMGYGPNTAHRELAALAQEGYLIARANQYAMSNDGRDALERDEEGDEA